MRELKFRGWNAEEKRMYYFDLREYMTLSEFSQEEECSSELRYTLMQYVGFKDKNGEEVYEGDHIQVSVHNYATGQLIVQRTTPVHYKNGQFGIEWPDGYGFSGFDEFSNTTFEIVGNIYEGVVQHVAAE